MVCSARKIQCDGGLPTCRKCDRAQRRCEGYEMRLSWPRGDDKRRAMTANNTSPLLVNSNPSEQFPTNLFFVNTTSKDMEMYGYLSGQRYPSLLIQPFAKLLRQPQHQVKHMDLVHHCKWLSHSINECLRTKYRSSPMHQFKILPIFP